MEPIGVLADDLDPQPGYYSYGVVPSGGCFQGIDDFKGKTLCFVTPASTLGYLYGDVGLLDAGIEVWA